MKPTLLRRPRAGAPRAEVYDDGRLLVRVTAREVSVAGTPVSLTPTEFLLLNRNWVDQAD